MGRNAGTTKPSKPWPPWYGAYTRQLRSTHRETLLEETGRVLQHLEILQAWQDQLRALLDQALGAVRQRCQEGSALQTESDIQTLASIGQWAKQERQRQLEGLSLLWKLLYGDWKPEKVMPFMAAPQVRVARHAVEMLQQLVKQVFEMVSDNVKAKHGPKPPSTPPPAHLLRRSQADQEVMEVWDEEPMPISNEAGSPASPIQPEPAEPDSSGKSVPDFDRQQQEFEHQKHQLQQELAAILQRREAMETHGSEQRISGLELLQELERVNATEPGSQQCQELQEQLQRELHMSQQQQLCQQMLQQLELEMELQRQESTRHERNASATCQPQLSQESQAQACSRSVDLQHCLSSLHQISEQIRHLELQSRPCDPTVDLDERNMLWTYLQAELDSPQETKWERGDGKRGHFGKGRLHARFRRES